MGEITQYIIVEWRDDLPGVDRYGFATVKHAEEMGAQVRCLDTFMSLERAAREVDRLNGRRQDGAESTDHGFPKLGFVAHSTKAEVSETTPETIAS